MITWPTAPSDSTAFRHYHRPYVMAVCLGKSKEASSPPQYLATSVPLVYIWHCFIFGHSWDCLVCHVSSPVVSVTFGTSLTSSSPHPPTRHQLLIYQPTMADDTATTEEAPITFTVKSSTDAKFTLTLPLSTLVSELKEKLSTSEYADTPADRQRLIYSGRVLKDNETLETYKIKDGHTIHLVKSAASNQQRANTSAPSATATGAGTHLPSQPAAGVPTNLAAGTGNNPLAGLTGARYAGFAQLPGAGLFGPDGGVSLTSLATHIRASRPDIALLLLFG